MSIVVRFEGLLINNIHHKGGVRGVLSWFLEVVSRKLIFDSGRKVVNKGGGES